MSGETEQNISGWTVDTLHSHVIRMLEEHDRRYEQRFTDLGKALDAAFAAASTAIATQEEAVKSALAAAEKAVQKAEMASEKRFEGVNEFRAALSDASQRNLSRTEYEAAHTNLTDQVIDLRSRFERYEARTAGSTSGEDQAKLQTNRIIGVMIGVGGLVVAGVGLAAALTR